VVRSTLTPINALCRIFMLGDDFGNYDISFHNPHIKSPTMGRLAAEGEWLNSSLFVCSCFSSIIHPYISKPPRTLASRCLHPSLKALMNDAA